MSSSSALAPNTPATPAGEPEKDAYNLERFIHAQDHHNTFEKVLAAFEGGHRKPQPSSTWMWFVFPQMNNCQTQSLRVRIGGDGISYEDVDEQVWGAQDVWPKGQALAGLDEARAYLRHPVLGERVRRAARAVLGSAFADKLALMDNMSMDVARLHSSMTIFRQATRFPRCLHDKRHQPGDNGVFAQVINRFFVRFASGDDEDDFLDYADVPLWVWKKGSRHKPTLECLDRQEKGQIERRLSGGLGCVCGHGQDKMDEMDRASKRSMDDARVALEGEKKSRRQRKEQKRKEQKPKEQGKAAAGAENARTDGKDPNSEKSNQVADPQLPASDAAFTLELRTWNHEP